MAQTELQKAIARLKAATSLVEAREAAKAIVAAIWGAIPTGFPNVPQTMNWNNGQSFYEGMIDTLDLPTLVGWGNDCSPWE